MYWVMTKVFATPYVLCMAAARCRNETDEGPAWMQGKGPEAFGLRCLVLLRGCSTVDAAVIC